MKVHVYLQQTQVLGEGEGCVVETRDLVAAERPANEKNQFHFVHFLSHFSNNVTNSQRLETRQSFEHRSRQTCQLVVVQNAAEKHT